MTSETSRLDRNNWQMLRQADAAHGARSRWTAPKSAAMTPQHATFSLPRIGVRDMLWDIRARMRPALAVIDLIPNIHRSAALTVLRRAVLDGRPAVLSLSAEDKELALYDAPVQLTSPIGARVLQALYYRGHLKLKKPAAKSLPALEAYIATEAVFRADVAKVLAAEDAKRQRLDEIIADPSCAHPEELSPYLIDKVMSGRLGHGVYGDLQIGGITCHRALSDAVMSDGDRHRVEVKTVCWWLDENGHRLGDPE